MPKKINGFVVFMKEIYEKEKKSGNNLRWADAANFVAPMWEVLSEDQKNVYRELAKKESRNNYRDSDNRTSSNQNKKLKLAKEIAELEKLEFQRNSTLSRLIDDFLDIAQDIRCEPFYIISFNHFCFSKNYIPAEVGIVRFTFNEGVSDTDKFDTKINPIKLPLGMAFEAKRDSKNTHKLPIPPLAEGIIYPDVLKNIKRFLRKYPDCRESLPMFFTIDDEIPIAESIMSEMHNGKGHDYRFLSLSKLLLKIVTKVNKEKDISGTIEESSARAALESDKYICSPNIACDFHEELDNSEHCALSKATRWCFTLSELCAKGLDIELKYGFHKPHSNSILINRSLQQETSTINMTTESTSTSSVSSSLYDKASTSTRD